MGSASAVFIVTLRKTQNPGGTVSDAARVYFWVQVLNISFSLRKKPFRFS